VWKNRRPSHEGSPTGGGVNMTVGNSKLFPSQDSDSFWAFVQKLSEGGRQFKVYHLPSGNTTEVRVTDGLPLPN